MHCGPPNQNFGLPCSATHGVWGALKAPPAGFGAEPRPQSHFAALYARKYASGCSIWFFGQHCSEWQNESQSRLRSNLVSAGNLRHINIIVVQNGKLIFVGSKFAAPLNFAALFGRTPRTCLRPALQCTLFWDCHNVCYLTYLCFNMQCTLFCSGIFFILNCVNNVVLDSAAGCK